MSDFSVTAADSTLQDGTDAIAVKISCPTYELNVWLRVPEVALLETVPETPWEQGSIQAGMSAGAKVFWSCDDGEVSVGVGHDDQTWDFGVAISLDDFEVMMTEIHRELDERESA